MITAAMIATAVVAAAVIAMVAVSVTVVAMLVIAMLTVLTVLAVFAVFTVATPPVTTPATKPVTPAPRAPQPGAAAGAAAATAGAATPATAATRATYAAPSPVPRATPLVLAAIDGVPHHVFHRISRAPATFNAASETLRGHVTVPGHHARRAFDPEDGGHRIDGAISHAPGRGNHTVNGGYHAPDEA